MNLSSPIATGGRTFKMHAGRLEKLGIFTFEDLILHLPSRYEDYSIISKIGVVQDGETVTVQGIVKTSKNQYLRGKRIKTIQKVEIGDDTGSLELVWFNQPYIIKSMTVGSYLSASGRIDISVRTKSIKSPTYEILYGPQTNSIHTGRLIPVYPETKGITSKWLRRQIYNILEQSENNLSEYLPENLIEENNFMHYPHAIKEVHFPKSHDNAKKAKERLAFDELLLFQLAANKRRTAWKTKKLVKPFKVNLYKKDLEKLIKSLPFTLTQSQQNSIDDILNDLSSSTPMNRLLQGDVGSGKTIVAAVAMYISFLNGFQSVLMAPTEILAIQHYETLSKLLSPFNIKVGLVTSSKKNIKYKEVSIKNEEKDKSIHNTKNLILDTDVLVGTHSVLSDKINFTNLGFIAIDEQQRFGVAQRGIMRKKNENAHLLTMTATPIPRTVALTLYGDLDLSYLKDMPKGRVRIKTWLVPPEKRNPGYAWIRKQIIQTNSQAFIICPFIEESESMNTIKAAKQEYERLTNEVFPDLKIGLLHGKMKSTEKTEILNKFRIGDFDILVATPVVEVGIDIPNATIMIIEAAERFGLAQLHQMRGRVGRGEKESYCLLFTDSDNAQNSRRLKGMETLYSGASLAELDLKLRGPGNMYGTTQHGIPNLKAASFSDPELLQKAKHVADKLFPVLSSYPKLADKVDKTTKQIVSPD